jgi:hypothetical protein
MQCLLQGGIRRNRQCEMAMSSTTHIGVYGGSVSIQFCLGVSCRLAYVGRKRLSAMSGSVLLVGNDVM